MSPSSSASFPYRQRVLAAAISGLGLFASPAAHAAVASACTGVSLPPSVVTNIVALTSPLAEAVDDLTLGLLGLQTGLDNQLASIAAGEPITLSALDFNGDPILTDATCDTIADSYALETPQGISIGGNRITGLGDGAQAQAGEANSIAFGNGAATDLTATGSIAMGTNSAVGTDAVNAVALGTGAVAIHANSVALGANSTTTTGAQTDYAAFGLAAPQTSAGEVSLGSVGAERKLTHVAAGSADTDAVNVAQLAAVDDSAVKYDDGLKMSVTLGGPTSIDGGLSNGTRISNLAQGVLAVDSTEAVNGAQLFASNLRLSDLENGVSGLVQQVGGAPGTGTITVGAATAGTLIDVSGTGGARVVTGVAAGAIAPGSTDAINGDQIFQLAQDVGAVASNAIQYNTLDKDVATLGGTTSTDGGVTGGTLLTNLTQGEVADGSTDAVNGTQLWETNLRISSLEEGGAGLVQQVGGAPGSGTITVGAATGGTLVSFAGTDGDRVLTDVAAGTLAADSSDAVNGGQLFTTNQNLAALDDAAVKYDDGTKASVTLGGAVSTDDGVTNGTRIGNLAQGVASTDAVNVAQVNALVQAVNNSDDIFYFNVNSGAADSVAGGDESIAVGPVASAAGDNAVAMGNTASAAGDGSVALGHTASSAGVNSLALGRNSSASNTGSIAIGLDTQSSGLNTIAIGTGAIATDSVAVGAGAQAGNGGAAFGDNSVALAFDRGTALGNAATVSADLGTAVGTGATVTSDRGVALGAGSTAARAGMNGATEAFSEAAVASTAGAVSVGTLGNERQITNVAGGTGATDAVNLRQLSAAYDQSISYTDTVFNTLRSDLSSFKDDARAGISAAMAMASMPQATLPGKSLVAAGVGNFQGQTSLSVGLSALSDNGRWVLKGQASADTQGNVGVGGGVGMHW